MPPISYKGTADHLVRDGVWLILECYKPTPWGGSRIKITLNISHIFKMGGKI